MTCNDCGRDINYCDRHGCREVNGVAWEKPRAPTEREANTCYCGAYGGGVHTKSALCSAPTVKGSL